MRGGGAASRPRVGAGLLGRRPCLGRRPLALPLRLAPAVWCERKKPRRRWPARLPAAQREEVPRSGSLLAARRSAGRVPGLELLPLLLAGLLLRLHRSQL